MTRKTWTWIFAGSIALNCSLALVLFEYALIYWSWSGAWLLLIAIPLLCLAVTTVWGWLMERYVVPHSPNTRALDPLQLGFTLRQEQGEPLCQLVLELRPAGNFQLSDINGWSRDTAFQ